MSGRTYGQPHEDPPSIPAGLLPLLTLLVFVVMMDQRVITAVLPEIADDFGTSVASVGLALTSYLIAYGTFQLGYGPLADRVGAVRVMSVACVLYAGAVALGAVAPGLGSFIGARLVTGALAAAFFPLALATIGNLVPYESRQQAIGTLMAALALGQVLGAAIGGFVTAAVSWRAMFAIDAALAALLIAPLWRYRSATPVAPRIPGAPLATHRRLLRDRRALVLYGAVLVEGGAFFGGTGYLGALLHDGYGLPLEQVGLILTLDGAALLVASRLVGRIRSRLGEGRMILTGGMLMGGAFLLASGLDTWHVIVPAVVALGAGFAICHSTLQTRATELAPEARGTAISLFAFSLFLGSAAGTALLGGLLDRSGYDAVMLASGVALVVMALLAPRLTARVPAPAAAAG
jgi:predicted MFS family arabinose efflux permease